MDQSANDRTMDHKWKMGADNMHGKGIVSQDGKTMTYTLTGTNSDGKPLHNVLLFEKQ